MDDLQAMNGNHKEQRGGGWRWAALGVLLAGLLFGYALGFQKYLTLSALIQEHKALSTYVQEHYVLALLLYLGIYIVSVALSFPGASILTIAGGYLFGWAISGASAVIGATIGAALVFLIARSSMGAILRERAHGWLGRMRTGFQENAFSYLLFLRLTPIFPFWLVNVAPALLGVPFSTYVSATILGIVPGTFTFSILGSGLGTLIEAQEKASPGCAEAGTCDIELSALVTPTLIAAFCALGLLALVPVVLKKWRKQ